MAVYLGDKQVGPIIAVVTDEALVNYEYMKQIDLLDAILGFEKINENNYTEKEMQRLEKILIDLTEETDG